MQYHKVLTVKLCLYPRIIAGKTQNILNSGVSLSKIDCSVTDCIFFLVKFISVNTVKQTR